MGIFGLLTFEKEKEKEKTIKYSKDKTSLEATENFFFGKIGKKETRWIFFGVFRVYRYRMIIIFLGKKET